MAESDTNAPRTLDYDPRCQRDKGNSESEADLTGKGAAPSPAISRARLPSRRGFLGSSARKIAYTAPLVLLFKPDEARAGSGGTEITQPP